MEAHIKLTLKDAVVSREIADITGAAYTLCISPFIATNNGVSRGSIKGSCYVKDELIYNEETHDYKDKNGDKVYDWDIYDSVVKNKKGSYVILQENQFVDMKLWCRHIHLPFQVVTIDESEDESAKTELEISKTVASLRESQEKFEHQIKEWIEGFEPMYNHQCSVNVGTLVTQFNEVKLIEDSCTDRLQDALNNGWRIISACVQPDSRRPDYILGRWNPEFII